MSKHSIQDKIWTLLKYTFPKGDRYSINMNRQEMADYLGVERSKPSKEPCRL